MSYVDVHTHLNLAAFKDDQDEVTKRALQADVWMVNVGTQLETSRRAVALLDTYEVGVFATVGLHPIHTSKSFFDTEEFDENEREFVEHGEVFDPDAYRTLVAHERVVAVGECGLDYFRDVSDEDKKKQREAFEAQVAFANEVNKPLMLHVRSGVSGDAYREVYDILKTGARVLGNAHFFAGTLEDAKRFWDLGFSTSFTGVITFTHAYDIIVAHAPKELLHAETDAPYVAPVPFRGHRNEPLHVREVVQRMAEIRNVPIEELSEQLMDNARRAFAIGR